MKRFEKDIHIPNVLPVSTNINKLPNKKSNTKDISIRDYILGKIFSKNKQDSHIFKKIVALTSKKLEMSNILKRNLDIEKIKFLLPQTGDINYDEKIPLTFYIQEIKSLKNENNDHFIE